MRRRSSWIRAVIIILAMLWVSSSSYVTAFHLQMPQQYDFIPYPLRIKPGTNGDGGISFAPPIMPTNPPSKILTYPLKLTIPSQLGYSGDYISEPLNSSWTVDAVVEGTSRPAILTANYCRGQIAYVTNQLAPQHELIYDLFAWHFGGLQNRTIKVAVMTESTVPPEQILSYWNDSFRAVERLAKENRTNWNIQYKTLGAFELEDSDLKSF